MKLQFLPLIFFLFYISSAAISHVMLSYPFGVLVNLYIIYLYILFILCYVYGNARWLVTGTGQETATEVEAKTNIS